MKAGVIVFLMALMLIPAGLLGKSLLQKLDNDRVTVVCLDGTEYVDDLSKTGDFQCEWIEIKAYRGE